MDAERALRPMEIAEILTNRATTYAFLSRVMWEEVPSELLTQLLDETAADPEAAEEVGEGYGILARYLEKVQASEIEQVRVDLGAEYIALMLSGRKSGVSPFESVYTSKDHILMADARDQVVALYQAEGLDRVGQFREPEDHLAIELEFMGYLCEQAAEALDRGELELTRSYLEKQGTFLRDHLLVWVPEFAHDLAQKAHSDFYRGIARMMDEFLSQEQETIEELEAALE